MCRSYTSDAPTLPRHTDTGDNPRTHFEGAGSGRQKGQAAAGGAASWPARSEIPEALPSYLYRRCGGVPRLAPVNSLHTSVAPLTTFRISSKPLGL